MMRTAKYSSYCDETVFELDQLNSQQDHFATLQNQIQPRCTIQHYVVNNSMSALQVC